MEGQQGSPETPLAQIFRQLADMQHDTATLQQQQSRALLAMDQRLQRAEAERQPGHQAGTDGQQLPADQAARRAHQRLLQDSLHKMTSEDDVEAFLEVFDSVASECEWTEDVKAWRLLPLLTGEAQLAAHGLPAASRLVYPDLKKAILDRLGHTPEGHRRRLRGLSYDEGGRPFVFAQQLREAARRWLQPGALTAEQVVERVVLEQFVAGLPSSTGNWVQCHRPLTLDAAVVLAEDHLSLPRRARWEDTRSQPPPPARPVPAPRRKNDNRNAPTPAPRHTPAHTHTHIHPH